MPLALRIKPFKSFFSSKTLLSCDFCSEIYFPTGIFVRSGKKWRFPLMAAKRVATAVVVVHPYSDSCPWPYVADPFLHGVHFQADLYVLSSYMRYCFSGSLIHLLFSSVCLGSAPYHSADRLRFANSARGPMSLPSKFSVGNLKYSSFSFKY